MDRPLGRLRMQGMLKHLLLTLLAACSSSDSAIVPTPEAPEGQPLAPPESVEIEEQHFCCSKVDAKTRTGDGCFLIAKDDLRLCTTAILYCPGFYTMDGGVVECPK